MRLQGDTSRPPHSVSVNRRPFNEAAKQTNIHEAGSWRIFRREISVGEEATTRTRDRRFSAPAANAESSAQAATVMARKGVLGRGRAKKVKKGQFPTPEDDEDHGNEPHSRELKDRKQLSELNHQEVERGIVAIQAIRDAHIEHVLTQLQFTRSMFSKEQLQMPLLQFLNEYCPNTLAVRNSEGIIELERKTQIHDVVGSHVDEKEWRASIGCQGSIGLRASTALDDETIVMPTSESFRFTSSAVKDNFLCSIGMHIPKAVFQENPEIKMINQERYSETPRMNLKMQPSIGMTPKSQRLPKRGEVLLSIHGSPLGVYYEDKMDTISESGKDP